MDEPLDIYELTKGVIQEQDDPAIPHPNNYIESLEGYCMDLSYTPIGVNSVQDWLDHMMTHADRDIINSPMYYALTFSLDSSVDSIDFTDAISYINDFKQIHVNYFTEDNYVTLIANASMQVTPAMILLLSQATIADTLGLSSDNFIYSTIDTIHEKQYYDLYRKGQDQRGEN